MCYNIAYMAQRQKKYAERYADVLPKDWSKTAVQEELPLFHFVSGFSHPVLPIIKHDGIFPYTWGLIPSWAKDLETANDIRTKTLNAVGETVFEKPSFRKSISKQRCLLGVAGFYEWRDINETKYPYFIKSKSSEIFSLGCIYETWVDQSTGEIRNTFSILTTPANPLMEKIHNLKKRMPLIISPRDEKLWVDPNLASQKIIELIKPYNESDMSAYTVSNFVNNARNDRNVPESIEPFEYAELSLIDG